MRADPRLEEERIGPAQRFASDLLRDPSVNLPVGASEAEEALSAGRSSTVRLGSPIGAHPSLPVSQGA